MVVDDACWAHGCYIDFPWDVTSRVIKKLKMGYWIQHKQKRCRIHTCFFCDFNWKFTTHYKSSLLDFLCLDFLCFFDFFFFFFLSSEESEESDESLEVDDELESFLLLFFFSFFLDLDFLFSFFSLSFSFSWSALSSSALSIVSGVVMSSSSLLVLLTSKTTPLAGFVERKFLHWNVKCPG